MYDHVWQCMNMLNPGSRSNCIYSPRAASMWRSSKKWWAWCFDLWHQGITETDAVSPPAFCREVWLLQSAITVLNRSCEAQLRPGSGFQGSLGRCPGRKETNPQNYVIWCFFDICFALYHWATGCFLGIGHQHLIACLQSEAIEHPRYHQWTGLRENLQESPMVFMGKSMVSG